ncbi:MAG: [protein-PII] uridylyltransferase [Nitrospinae bacterium]|nr:[protein-PII] uridylyltransferase [Nitrospinota bacterium]
MDNSENNYRLAIDFSPVKDIPADPKKRLPYFQTFKQLLKDEKEKIKSWHRSGSGGREIIQAHTSLVDEVIRHVLLSMTQLDEYAKSNVLNGFALIAVGGYGRGELNPLSDIDLLFLLSGKEQPITETFIKDALSLIWGFDMEIGHSSRTIKDCIKLAQEDLTIKTSMIETRFLIGNRTIYEKFYNSIHKNVLQKHVKKFLNSKLQEKYTRYGQGDSVVCHPEPDIKNGPGGLRDYHSALWATAVRYGCHSLREINEEHALSNEEIESLYHSVDFSLRVRNELHYLTEKKTDVLTFDIQKQLATNLGYQSSAQNQAVEEFMRDYYLHATNIYTFSQNLFEHCRQPKRSLKKVISSLTKKSVGHGFHISDSSLIYDGDAKENFKKDKSLLLLALELCKQHQVLPDYKLQRQMRLSKNLINAQFMKGEEVRGFLFSILKDRNAEKILRLMHETDILEQILPEFGLAHCKVNHDFYHHYTADEHSLRVIRFLDELASTSITNPTDLHTLYKDYPRKGTLKLSALLQSIQTMPSDEPDEFLKSLTDRLSLEKEDVQVLLFLLANPYTLIETALHQDIHQPAVIRKFSKTVANPERLKGLYLLSYAELRAVAPGTLTAWKKILLSELFERTLKHLQDPESLDQQPLATRAGVFKALQRELPVNDIEEHLRQMPDDYLMTASSEEVALHIRLIRSFKDKLFILHHQFHEEGNYHNLTLCCPIGSEAFKKLVGTITAKSLNILGAQIYLKKDGIIFVSLQVEANTKAEAEDLEVWKDIKNSLSQLFEGKTSLQEMLKTRIRYAGEQKKMAMVPRVYVEKTAGNPFTEIRVEARDHIGMLYKVSAVFADFGIRIHRAKISTQGDRAIDVFYISLRNPNFDFNKVIRSFKEHMLHTLMIEKLEDIR